MKFQIKVYIKFIYIGKRCTHPFNFNSGNSNANDWNVNSTGNLNNTNVWNGLGVRPQFLQCVDEFITISYGKMISEETSVFLAKAK